MEEEAVPEGLHWNKPHFYDGSQCFIPKVYDGSHTIPEGFNTVVIKLEGGMRASLEWTEALEKGRQFIQEGYKILWEIDLGLAGSLHYSYGNAMQHQALGLALEHFRDTLWSQFRAATLGLIFYRGHADHTRHFVWDDRQRSLYHMWAEGRDDPEALYCARVAVDYMRLLTMRLPDALRLFALLDCTGLENLLLLSQLVSRERYDPIHLVLKGAPFTGQELAWQEGSAGWGYVATNHLPLDSVKVKIAVVIPALELSPSPRLRHAMEDLQRKRIPFRIIPEAMLTTEWDELDELICCDKTLSPQGRRKLQGFIAAGGQVVKV